MNKDYPIDGGICLTCDSMDSCPMPEMLSEWEKIKIESKRTNVEIPYYVRDEYYIDEPEKDKKGNVEWCPYFCGQKMEEEE